MRALNTMLSLRKSHLSQAALAGLLALSGCTAERRDEPKPAPQEKVSTAPAKPAHREVGEASWYGPGFHGKKTASGETFNQNELTAAHPKLPLGTKAEVTNLETGKKVEVEINDRGPHADNRSIDVSRAAAKKLGMEKDGTAEVRIEAKPDQQNAQPNSAKTK